MYSDYTDFYGNQYKALSKMEYFNMLENLKNTTQKMFEMIPEDQINNSNYTMNKNCKYN